MKRGLQNALLWYYEEREDRARQRPQTCRSLSVWG